MTAGADLPEVPEIVETMLRPVFRHEAHGFTRWMAQPVALDRLGRALGLSLVFEGREQSTGNFRLDLLARDVETDGKVVIENQFEGSDHDHLGKVLAYMAAIDAKTAIWVAESFRDEHRKALEWLNDVTGPDISFWGVVPRMLRVGNGPAGLRFDVEVRPNPMVKAVRAEGWRIDQTILEILDTYWRVLLTVLRNDPRMNDCVTKRGGKLGDLSLYPSSDWAAALPKVYVIMYLMLGGGSRTAAIGFRFEYEPALPNGFRDQMAELRSRRIVGAWDTETELENIARQHVELAAVGLSLLAGAVNGVA